MKPLKELLKENLEYDELDGDLETTLSTIKDWLNACFKHEKRYKHCSDYSNTTEPFSKGFTENALNFFVLLPLPF